MFVRRDDDGRFGRLLLLRGFLQGFCLTRPPWNSRGRRALLDRDGLGNFPPLRRARHRAILPGAPRRERGQEQEPTGRETRSSARDFGFCHRSMPLKDVLGHGQPPNQNYNFKTYRDVGGKRLRVPSCESDVHVIRAAFKSKTHAQSEIGSCVFSIHSNPTTNA